jgi:hypothetical protein
MRTRSVVVVSLLAVLVGGALLSWSLRSDLHTVTVDLPAVTTDGRYQCGLVAEDTGLQVQAGGTGSALDEWRTQWGDCVCGREVTSDGPLAYCNETSVCTRTADGCWCEPVPTTDTRRDVGPEAWWPYGGE